MSFFDVVSLSFLQGLTEFLPISSSAHLALWPLFFDFADPGLAFSAALHLGTLLAVVWYFRRRLRQLAKALFVRGGRESEDRRLAGLLIAATVPAAAAGFLWEDMVSTDLRSPRIIAALLVAGSLFLYLGDRFSPRGKDGPAALGLGAALVIGLFQALAVVPGLSRSGLTLAAGRICGLSRAAAAEFSFLLAVPIIAGAGLLEWPKVVASGFGPAAAIGAATAFAVAYATIAVFMKFIREIPLVIFLWYGLFLFAAVVFWL